MIRAISVTQANLGQNSKLSDEGIDIVTDRNNLRKLMRFIGANGPNQDPRPNRNRSREFRIDAQLAQNGRTLVLTRYEESTVDSATSFKGYGHNFELAVTVERPPLVAVNQSRTVVSRFKTTGYHRIIRYDLLGLRFMVRFEVDAMGDEPPSSPSVAESQNEVDDLAELLAGTIISQPTSAPPKLAAKMPTKPAELISVEGSDLRHILYGEQVSQASLIELATLSSKFDVIWCVQHLVGLFT
jgi:hypothetical protein